MNYKYIVSNYFLKKTLPLLVFFLLQLQCIYAQWEPVENINPTYIGIDYLCYGPNAEKLYHSSAGKKSLIVYDENYNTAKAIPWSGLGFERINRMQSHYNDTLYVEVEYRAFVRGLTIITNNASSVKFIDTINNVLIRGNYWDMIFHTPNYGVVRTRNGNFVTTDGGNTWLSLDTSKCHFNISNRPSWSFTVYLIDNKGFMVESSFSNGKNFLTYSNDYGQNVYEKAIPQTIKLAAIKDAANHLYIGNDSADNYKAKYVYFTNDSANTFYRIDTFSGKINNAYYVTPINGDSFYMVLTDKGSFYFEIKDSTWKSYDNLNLLYLDIYSSNKGFAYNPELANTNFFRLLGPLSVKNIKNKNSYSAIYPNPASDIIQLPKQTLSVSAIDLTGQSHTLQLDTQQHTCNVSTLAPGVYFLQMQDANGNAYVQKLVVSR